MKTLKLILIACSVVFLQSCYDPGDIQVQNKISQVKIQQVKWGDTYLTWELLPGETSPKQSIPGDKLPQTNKISFIMTANNKSIYLETEEAFTLEENGNIKIVLDDSTGVKSPNE